MASFGLYGTLGQAGTNQHDEGVLLRLYGDIHLSANSKHFAQRVALNEAFVSHRAYMVWKRQSYADLPILGETAPQIGEIGLPRLRD